MTSPTNGERILWAEGALLDFCAATVCSHDEALIDLLTDLMHWSAATNRNFTHALKLATMHFKVEVQP